jgi:hypothetical protein
MFGHVRRPRVASGLFALLLPGCLSCFNPTPDLVPEIKQQCQLVSPYCRDNVYVVLVNGADPLCCGNLKGVRDYLNSLGFVKCYYAQLYHEGCLLEELRNVREVHPDARIAVVGFECGASTAQNLARRATEEGLTVDLLMLLEPKDLSATSHVSLPAVPRVIAVRAGKLDSRAPDGDFTETIMVPCLSRYGVPTHPVTLQTLVEELSQLAMNVPIQAPAIEQFPAGPTPRPVAPEVKTPMDDWDFLKPVIGQRTEQDRFSTSLLPQNQSK